MSCQQTHDLIDAYLDGEIDVVKSIEIEKHVADCDACTQRYKSLQSLQTALGDSAVRFEPPPSLEERLRSALHRETDSQPARNLRWAWILAAASLVSTIVVIAFVVGLFARQPTDDLLAQEVISSHVRSLMANHLTDVPSSDQHTVKPWFNGKLDFSPTVKDLSQQGFKLNGGRLDYLGKRPVAALVYQRRQHAINVFVWPSTDTPASTGKASEREGYNLIRWSNGGMTYWAISDLNLAELQQFVELLQDQSASLY